MIVRDIVSEVDTNINCVNEAQDAQAPGSESQENAKQKRGFFAAVPRIVRTKYKLTHAEKWLYVCLKDLCGEKGTCYRTLRALEEETDIAYNSLSKMILNLDKVGLISAEKKSRAGSKPIWHIHIIDIWDKNAKACSRNEQSSDVREMGNKPDFVRKNEQGCSRNEQKPTSFVRKNEQGCSRNGDRRKNTEERTILEERTGEEKPGCERDQKPTTPPHPDASPSLSAKINDWLTGFDSLYQELSGISNYRYSRKDDKTKKAILSLIETGATFEQAAFVFKDIWNDKTIDKSGTMFWQEHKGKVWVVESQFTARVCKMNQQQATQKRRTASGFTNWTEDKNMGVPATVRPAAPIATTNVEKPITKPEPTMPTVNSTSEKPAAPIAQAPAAAQDKSFTLTPGYTRLKMEKSTQPRSLEARLRLLAQKKDLARV